MKFLVLGFVVFLVSCGGSSSNENGMEEFESQYSVGFEDLHGVWVSDCMPLQNATTDSLASLLAEMPYLEEVWIIETIRIDEDSIAFDYSIHGTEICIDDAGHDLGLDLLMVLINGDRSILNTSQFMSSDNFSSVHIEFGQVDNSERTDVTVIDGRLHKVQISVDNSSSVYLELGYSKT